MQIRSHILKKKEGKKANIIKIAKQIGLKKQTKKKENTYVGFKRKQIRRMQETTILLLLLYGQPM